MESIIIISIHVMKIPLWTFLQNFLLLHFCIDLYSLFNKNRKEIFPLLKKPPQTINDEAFWNLDTVVWLSGISWRDVDRIPSFWGLWDCCKTKSLSEKMNLSPTFQESKVLFFSYLFLLRPMKVHVFLFIYL